MLPLNFQLSSGKSIKYRFIEFFVFDYGSFPYLLPLFFWSGVAFDKDIEKLDIYFCKEFPIVIVSLFFIN